MTLRSALKIIAADRARFLLALAAVGILATTAITLGSWTVGSSAGNGYSKAITAQNVTLSDASGQTTAQLYPGGTGDLVVKVTNPNSFAVTVTGVSGAGTITSDKGTACNNATGVTYTNTTGLSQVVGSGATVTFSVVGKVAMSTASDNSCQGAIFTVPITVTATS
ncbi:MAG TPA: hypothetical protein VH538_10290 [Gaiellaceae bacterium]|jgi:hypothetical protein